ncbi:magnesium transporter [bacterium]|nr:magnesium transporter [bacterium]
MEIENEDERVEELLDTIEEHIEGGKVEELKSVMESEHPGDIADAIQELDDDEQNLVFGLLEDEQAGDVLEEANTATRLEIIEDLEADELSDIIVTMPPDEAVDLLEDMPIGKAEEVLGQIPEDESEQLKELLKYPPDSAGGIMTPAMVKVRGNLTVEQALEHLRRTVVPDSIFYIYVVDSEGKLLGTVRIRRLITSDLKIQMCDLLEEKLITVPVEMDQEEVAKMFNKHDLLAMPVVDSSGVLLGQITVDDVMDVMEEEATEDAFKLAGTDDAELKSESAFKIARIRLVWLLICLMGTMISGSVIRLFQPTLSHVIAMAAFIPAIMAMGGNSGLQTTTVTVRGLATGELSSVRIFRLIFREVRVSLLIASVCGLIMGVVAKFWVGKIILGAIVGCAMFCTITFAATLGVILPLTFNKLKIDPAVASGPFITTMNDTTSLLIYFTLINLMLK